MLNYFTVFFAAFLFSLVASISSSQQLTAYLKFLVAVDAGQYPVASQNFIDEFIAEESEDDLYIATALSSYLIMASETKNYQALDWAYGNVQKEAQRLWDEGGEKQRVSFRLSILNDLAKMQEPRLDLGKRVDFLKSHNEIEYITFLTESEYVFACNTEIDLLIELREFPEAKTTLFKCAGHISNFENINPTEALSFLARIRRVRGISGIQSGNDRFNKTLEKLLQSEFLYPNSPTFLNAVSVLAVSEAFIGSDYALLIHDFMSQKVAEGIFVPELALLNTEWSYRYLDSTIGAPTKNSLKEFDFDKKTLDQLKLLRVFADNPTKNAKLSIAGDIQTITPSLLQLSRVVENSKNTENYNEAARNLNLLNIEVDKDYSDQLSYTTFEKAKSGYDYLVDKTLIAAFFSKDQSLLSDDISEELFRIFFKTERDSDFVAASASDLNLTNNNLDYFARSYLKLAKDLEYELLLLSEEIAASSLTFARLGFQFRNEKDTVSGPGYDFLSKYRLYALMVEQFQIVSSGSYRELMSRNHVSIDRVQNALSSDEIVVAYKRFGHIVFRCFVRQNDHDCYSIVDEELVPRASTRLRNAILGGEKDIRKDSDAKFLYDTLFGDLNLDKYSKIFIYPPKEDLAVPFNVLVRDGEFLGLKHDIFLLTSLIPKQTRFSDTVESNGYFGIGNPNYSQTIVASNEFLEKFNLRSGARVDAIESLSPLPDTEDEIKQVSFGLGSIQKKLLLGKAATELQFRRTDFSKYKIYHFATHGLVSGEITNGNEPALVLSVPSEIKSSFNDALLTETEILEFDFRNATIFLSACQTASDFGAIVNSGYNGLANAFLIAGATQVVATQWSIESRSAAKIISEAVNLEISNSSEQLSAVRQAQRTYYEEGDSAPYYWAPYIRFTSLFVDEAKDILSVKAERVTDIPYTERYGYEADEFFVYDDELYLTGTQLELDTQNPAKGFLKKIDTGELIVFDTPMHNVYFGMENKIFASTIERKGTKIFPSISELDLDSHQLRTVFSIEPKMVDDEFDMLFITRSRQRHNGEVEWLLKGTINYNKLTTDSAKTQNHKMLQRTFLASIDKSLNLKEIIELPPTVDHNAQLENTGVSELIDTEFTSLDYNFVGNEIYALEKKFIPKPFEFDARFGISKCKSQYILVLSKLDQKNMRLIPVYEFEDGQFYNFVDDKTILLEESCAGVATFSRMLSLDDLSLSDRLPVVMGEFSDLHAYTFQNGGQLFLGTLSSPASFRLKRNNLNDDDFKFQRLDFVLNPANQYLRFLVYGDWERGFENIDLQFLRQFSYISDIIEFKGELFIAGKENEAFAFVEKYALDEIVDYLNLN